MADVIPLRQPPSAEEVRRWFVRAISRGPNSLDDPKELARHLMVAERREARTRDIVDEHNALNRAAEVIPLRRAQ